MRMCARQCDFSMFVANKRTCALVAVVKLKGELRFLSLKTFVCKKFINFPNLSLFHPPRCRYDLCCLAFNLRGIVRH